MCTINFLKLNPKDIIFAFISFVTLGLAIAAECGELSGETYMYVIFGGFVTVCSGALMSITSTDSAKKLASLAVHKSIHYFLWYAFVMATLLIKYVIPRLQAADDIFLTPPDGSISAFMYAFGMILFPTILAAFVIFIALSMGLPTGEHDPLVEKEKADHKKPSSDNDFWAALILLFAFAILFGSYEEAKKERKERKKLFWQRLKFWKRWQK